MAKKKAPSNKSTEPNKNPKKIIAVEHRQIKHTGKKYDNAFAEIRVWLPLWELPLWIPNGSTELGSAADNSAFKKIIIQLLGGSHVD